MRELLRDQNCRKPTNPNYEKDIAYVIKHNKWVLTSIGVWPVALEGVKRFLPNFVFGGGNLVLFFAIIPCFFYIVYEKRDIIIKLKLIGLLTFCVISLLKYWSHVMRSYKIKGCIEQVQDDWKRVESPSDRKLMLKYGKFGRDLTISSAIFMYAAGLIYHTIVQYANGTYIDENNRTIKPLVYPIYSGLYNAQRTPIYQLVYLVHCMCGYLIYSVTAGTCGLAALFTMHICGQIDIMMARLGKLVDYERHSKPNARLKEIVERHLKILRFSATVETILQEICFFEFVGSMFLICLLEYYCISDWEKSNIISFTTSALLLISLTFNIFILCYIGELLMRKTSDIGLWCFMIDWYYLPVKTIQGLIMIMAMSNNPVKISAIKIADLNLSTFGNVLKTSLAYLSFLRTAVV